jgi:peptidoglycan/xylan/chitin deacetylase (PgdA/CDA1 family)
MSYKTVCEDMKIKPWAFLRRLYPDMIWEIDDSNGLFITFDDGPTPGVTEWVLATLKRYDAKATFFVLGKNAEMYPDLYQRIIDEGHKIGNHTYSHQRGWGMSLERYTEDVDLAADILHTELFRPPYARVTPAQMRAVGQRYKIIMWNVLSRDYNTHRTPKMCLRETIKGLRGGDIISMHDSAKSFKNTSYILPALLRKARAKGLKCKIIEL